MVLLSYQNIDKLIEVTVAGMRTIGAGGGTSRARGQLQCPSCGAPLNPGAKFCRACGAPTPVQEVTEAASPQCSNCGAALSAGSKFCSECGTAVG
jgi:rRNA maturation endonuclease Nob1